METERAHDLICLDGYFGERVLVVLDLASSDACRDASYMNSSIRIVGPLSLSCAYFFFFFRDCAIICPL